MGEMIFAGLETADPDRQVFGQHADDAVHQIGAVAAAQGFAVDIGAGFDIGGDIRDVDAQAPAAVGEGFDGHRVVIVMRAGRVDRQDGPGAQVDTPAQGGGLARLAGLNPPGGLLDRFGKCFGKSPVQQERRDVVFNGVRIAKILGETGRDRAPFGRVVFRDFGDHQMPDPGGECFGGIGQLDVGSQQRVARDHIGIVGRGLEDSDHPLAFALDDAHHAGRPGVWPGAEHAPGCFRADRHGLNPVAVHGHAGGLGINR